MKGCFNRLSQLHQSGIIIRSPRNASKIGFLNSKSFFSKLVSSFRSPTWLHYWHFYHNYVTKPFPEMLIDWSSEKKTDLIKEKLLNVLISRSSEDWKQSLNFMMHIPHTCN